MGIPPVFLGENFTLKDVHSRVELLCNQVEEGAVKPASITENLKLYMLKTVMFGSGAFKRHFRVTRTAAISASSTVSWDGFGLRHLVAIYEPDANLWGAGDDGTYEIKESRVEFSKVQKNKEMYRYSRFAYVEGGDKQALVWTGSAVTRSANVYIVFERDPYVGFGMSDVDDDTQMIDIPDFLVPYVVHGAAVSSLQEAGVRQERIANLQNDYREIMVGLNNLIQSDRARNDQKNED